MSIYKIEAEIERDSLLNKDIWISFKNYIKVALQSHSKGGEIKKCHVLSVYNYSIFHQGFLFCSIFQYKTFQDGNKSSPFSLILARYEWACNCVSARCPVIDRHPILGEFPPHAHCFCLHCDSSQDNTVTENEQLSVRNIISQRFIHMGTFNRKGCAVSTKEGYHSVFQREPFIQSKGRNPKSWEWCSQGRCDCVKIPLTCSHAVHDESKIGKFTEVKSV